MTGPFEAIYNEELYQISPPLVVILNKEWKAITSDEQVLLGKILASVKQSLNSVRIICAETIAPSGFQAGSKIISFGVAFTPDIKSYELTESNDSHFIKADALLSLDDAKKKSLWGEMKKLMIVNAA
jgi:hypothetical protein